MFTGSNKFSSTLIFLAIIAILIVVGGYLYLRSSSAGGWKQYTNSKYGFQINYPANIPVMFTDIQGPGQGSAVIVNTINGMSTFELLTHLSSVGPLLQIQPMTPAQASKIGSIQNLVEQIIPDPTNNNEELLVDFYNVQPQNKETYTQLLKQITATLKFQ